MSDVQPPAFDDGQTHAQESPSTTGEDTNPDYAEFQAWKERRNAPADPGAQNYTASDIPGPQNFEERRAVDTGRGPAPTESVKQDLPPKVEEEEETPQSYVHLANGQVLLVDDEDLPGSAGHQNQHGYWQQGNKVHTIVGVYPKEITVKD